MIPDYHIHTSLCGHATGAMKEYVSSALAKGFTEIGFSDHVPQYFLPVEKRDSGIAMGFEELPRYVADVMNLNREYDGINIKLGIEADYVPGHERELKQILEKYPFDYILGSVHYIDGWGFDDPDYIEQYKTLNIGELYKNYFKLVRKLAESSLFDIVAHPDLIKKFGYKPGPEFNLKREYEATADAIAASGMCIELNTAGFRVPVKEAYPAPDFLKACCKRKIPVTMGSDAHCPAQVGDNFNVSFDLLKQAGYRETVCFSQRKIKAVPLD